MPRGSGYGIKITTSDGFWGYITNVSRDGLKRNIMDMTHAESPDNRMEFDPSDLVDEGELTVQMLWDEDKEPPIDGPKGAVTIEYPLRRNKATRCTLAGDGFLHDFSEAVPIDDKMTATGKIKMSGKWLRTIST